MSRNADRYRRIVADLAAHTPDQFADAEARLRSSFAAWPGAASYDGTRRGGSSSPVEALAAQPDPAATQAAELERRLRQAEADVMWIRYCVAKNLSRHPSAKDQAEVARLNADPDDCQHHAKLDIYEPMKGKGPTDVAGNLPHPMRLCESCYRHVYRQGVLPPADRLVREHHAGKPERTRVSTPRRR